jgi:hypothetical protein
MKRIIVIFVLLFLFVGTPTLAQDSVYITPTSWDLLGMVWSRLGQKLTLNGSVAKLAFALAKTGSPTGDVTFAIRTTSNDTIIVSKVWGDASQLTDTWFTWYEVTFDSPIFINEEVRLSCEWDGGDAENYVMFGYRSGNVITGQYYTNYAQHSWHDIEESEEGCYNYTYGTSVPAQNGRSMNIPVICASIAGVGALAFVGIQVKRRHK